MENKPYIPERFFDRFDEGLSDREQLQMLKQCEEWLRETEDRLEHTIDLPPEDVEILQEYSSDKSPLLRKFAVHILCEHGPVDWYDLERFLLDPDREVRIAAQFGMDLSYFYATRLCGTDIKRAVALLGRALEKCEESYTSVTFWVLMKRGSEWQEAVWAEIERLWDLDDPGVREILACGVLEKAEHDDDDEIKSKAIRLTRRPHRGRH
jgi:hypothetical protein